MLFLLKGGFISLARDINYLDFDSQGPVLSMYKKHLIKTSGYFLARIARSDATK